MDANKEYSTLNSTGDCKNIIKYMGQVLKCKDMFHPSGKAKGDLFYGKSTSVKYYKQSLEIYAEVPDQEPQFVCQCDNETTTDFIISALRHCMPRYWDVKGIEDDSRKNCTQTLTITLNISYVFSNYFTSSKN